MRGSFSLESKAAIKPCTVARSRDSILPLSGFEEKQLISAGHLTEHIGSATAHARTQAVEANTLQHHLPTKFLAFRVTNTSYQTPYELIPPFQQVMVQSTQPKPGRVYNVLQIAVKNGTAQTFNASNGFKVRLSGERKSFPILTGTELWKPKQVIVLYVLTKKYYPVSPVAGGFILNLGGASSTLVPGPSGIFLRVKYNPSTFAKTLNWIVAYGPGNQGVRGAKYGLPNTAINEIVAASTRRIDFGGAFNECPCSKVLMRSRANCRPIPNVRFVSF